MDGDPRGRRRFGDGLLKLFDPGVGALERLVLDQHRLHQRIDRVGRAAEALANQPLGVGVAPLMLTERPGVGVKPVTANVTSLPNCCW